jgi:hypothetical protein
MDAGTGLIFTFFVTFTIPSPRKRPTGLNKNGLHHRFCFHKNAGLLSAA